MRAVGVGDENLPKGFTTYKLNDAFHTNGIQLVEDIVEQ